MTAPAQMVALRCRYCSAPLDAPSTPVETVTCRSCGTAQKMLDARQYLEELKLSVSQWLRQAVPLGLDISHGANVDPIARYGVFVNNVKPRLDTEFNEYRFNMSSLLAQPLTTLPFLANNQVQPANQPKDVFLFQAKIQAIQPLAVNAEAQKVVNDANAVAVSYAYLLNNVRLLGEGKPDRFALMSDNFAAASKAMAAAPEMFPGLVDRLSAESFAAVAADQFMDGKLPDAARSAAQALELYQTGAAAALTSMASVVMLQGMRDETSTAEAIGLLTNDSTGDPVTDSKVISAVQSVCSLVQNYPQIYGNSGRLHGIVRRWKAMRLARQSAATTRVLPGKGNVFYPFWIVDLRYSFVTGALWAKKGVEVSEFLLVAANAFVGGSWNSPWAVTDVFRARMKGGAFDSLTGKETSISGGGVAALLKQSTSQHLGLPAIPPLSSESDASEMATAYLNTTIMTDPQIQRKLKLSQPRVVEIAYVPAQFDGRGFAFPQFGALSPREVGNPATLASIQM